MKKTKFVKFATLITVFAMLVGVMAGVSFVANAEEEVGAESTGYTVAMKNLIYADYFHIALTVTEAPVEGDKGIAVFAEGETEEPIYVTTTEYYDNGVEYYKTQAVEARNIGAKYTYYPIVVMADGTTFYGDAFEYSVIDYCYERLEKDTISAAQETLYNAVIEYGKAAGAVIK